MSRAAIAAHRAISARHDAVVSRDKALPDVWFEDGQLRLNYCRRCRRYNEAHYVALGTCAWCRWNDPLDNAAIEALHELDDPQVLAEVLGEGG